MPARSSRLSVCLFFFSSRRRHTRYWRDWSSDVCSSDLDDVAGRETRYLMQIVDVLGDDGRNLASPVERGQRAVTASRLCCGECRFHREAPPPCLVPGLRTGDKFIEWNRTVAGPQSAR